MTYFVRRVGNNGNDGKSKDDAWLTVTYALSNISDGDTLIIGAGDYSAESLDASSLTDIRIIGDRHGTKTGDAGVVTVASCNVTDDAYIEHITIVGDMTVAGDWVVLTTCTVGGSIIINDRSRGCKILTCCITNSVIATDPDGVEVLSSTILGNAAQSPIVINSGSNISIKNCIVNAAANEYVVSFNIPDETMNFDNNLYWSESGNFAYNIETSEIFSGIVDWQQTGQDTGSRYEDPLLTGFEPASNSPAIEMGYPVGSTEDKTGRSRHFLQYDIGAVQRVLPTPLPTIFSERRFRFESPLMSSSWIDMLSEFQRWIAQFFGLDTAGSVVTQGLAQRLIEIIDSNITGMSNQIENINARIDNIKGSIHSLKSRNWE